MMFLKCEVEERIYVSHRKSLKYIKQSPAKVFRSLEGRRKVWFMFLKATWHEERGDQGFWLFQSKKEDLSCLFRASIETRYMRLTHLHIQLALSTRNNAFRSKQTTNKVLLMLKSLRKDNNGVLKRFEKTTNA